MIGRRGLVSLIGAVVAVVAITASAMTANAATTSAAAPVNHGRLLPSVALPVNFAPEGIARGEGSTFYAASLTTGDIYQGNLSTGKGFVLAAPPGGGEAVGLKQMGQIICCSSAVEPRAPPMSTIPAPEHSSLSISSAPTGNR